MQAIAYVLLLAPIVGLAATINMRAAKGIFQTPRLAAAFCSVLFAALSRRGLMAQHLRS